MREMRLKIGTKSDQDAADRGEGADLPVPVRRPSTLDGLLAGLTDLTDAVARRPPTMRGESLAGQEELSALEERPVDPQKAADERWRSYAHRIPTVVTKPSSLAPHLEERRAMGLTRWERFCDVVRDRPHWTDALALIAGVLMMLFSIAVLAYVIHKVGL